MKVVLTHLWPESNAGDYAIVRGTIDAIEDASSEKVDFVGISTFDKHTEKLKEHFPETLSKGVDIHPAIVAGYKNDSCDQFSKFEKIILSIKYMLIYIFLRLGLATLASMLVSPEKRKTLNEIRQADLVVIKGGAFLMGFPGLPGTLYLLRNALTVMWCACLNKNCVIAPHSFGPIVGGFQYWLLGQMLQGVKIFAREKISIDLLRRSGLVATYLPDMAFYFGVQEPKKKNINQIAVTVRPCPTFLSHDKQQSYYNEIVLALAVLANEGYSIVFVPQVSGPDSREDDREAIKIVKEKLVEMLGASELVQDVNAETLKEKFDIYGRSVLCLGTRMHSVIFSTLAQSKVVAMAYLGPKHQGIMDELSLGKYVLDISNVKSDDIISMVRDAILSQRESDVAISVNEMKKEIAFEFSNIIAGVRGGSFK